MLLIIILVILLASMGRRRYRPYGYRSVYMRPHVHIRPAMRFHGPGPAMRGPGGPHFGVPHHGGGHHGGGPRGAGRGF